MTLHPKINNIETAILGENGTLTPQFPASPFMRVRANHPKSINKVSSSRKFLEYRRMKYD